MSSEIDNTDKLLSLRDECKRMGLMVKAPNVLEGKHHFSVNSEGQIIYGLAGLRGLARGQSVTYWKREVTQPSPISLICAQGQTQEK